MALKVAVSELPEGWCHCQKKEIREEDAIAKKKLEGKRNRTQRRSTRVKKEKRDAKSREKERDGMGG